MLLLLPFLSGILSAGAQVRGDYTISGDLSPVIASWGVEPDSISMIFMQDHKIDTVALREGQFAFSGSMNARYVPSYYLRLFGPGMDGDAVAMTIPVFLEPGHIRVRVRELPDEDMFDIIVEGTPSNDLISSRTSRTYDLTYRMLDVAQDSTLGDDEKMVLVEELYEQFDSLQRYLYRDNRQSAIAPMLALQQFYGTNAFAEAGRELTRLEEAFPGHPDLHDLESVWLSMPGISVGDTIPEVFVKEVFGGQCPTPQGYLLIDFWSSLSGPNLDDFGALKNLPDTYNGLPLRLIGISTDNSREVWQKSLKQHKPAGIQHWDEGHNISKAFHITTYPTRFLVDPQGVVAAKGNFTELPDPAKTQESEDSLFSFP